MMDVRPVTLEGIFVSLEPLAMEHHEALCQVGLDPALWEWTMSAVRSVRDLHDWISAALRARDAGYALPFVTRERATGRIVGSTRYGNIDRANRRVEIGWTWVAVDWQRTAINTEAKYLMLEHAFEVLKCIRVELKTDVLNRRSRNAILRIGAIEEGVLRHHAITASGRIRDTVYYSILADEWPAVRDRLKAMLERSDT